MQEADSLLGIDTLFPDLDIGLGEFMIWALTL